MQKLRWAGKRLKLLPPLLSLMSDIASAHGASQSQVALNWLINELSGLSIALKEGQIVTTGTATIPLEIKNGDTVFADFGALGIVSATFQT